MPICEELAEPKHVTCKFNAADAENISDPITKPKIPGANVDYSENPWYQYLDEQLMKLREQGIEKQKEIEELRNPKPLPPLKKRKDEECEISLMMRNFHLFKNCLMLNLR